MESHDLSSSSSIQTTIQLTQVPSATHLTPTASQGGLSPYTMNIAPGSSSLAEMLSSIDALDVIPKLQEINQSGTSPVTMTTPHVVIATNSDKLNKDQIPPDEKKKGRVGRPRTKPQKEKTDWHYHLGGVRHSRTPLTPEIREVLEVAYVSKIMAKNFRKEGQPEKERIAKVTGLPVEKVQEWFKNRRKKDKLLKERQQKQSAAVQELSTESYEYPVTMEAVEQTEEWFKNRHKTKQDQKQLSQQSNYEYPLTVSPGFLEVHTSSGAVEATTHSTQPPNSGTLASTTEHS